jgi:UDP-N-acetylmuramoyl-tripeptide--D-alanyl-D-alanine ligase
VPLTLLRLRPEHELAVIELGMNHPGEIPYLVDLVRPTVALVNNAQREHQEFMETVHAVALENGAVLSALPTGGAAVFPADEDYTPLWRKMAHRASITEFALDGAHSAAVRCLSAAWHAGTWQIDVQTPQGPASYRLRSAGRHNVKNSLAALACALAAGVTLADAAAGLAAFEAVKGRSKALSLDWAGRAVTVIDDSYNANPDSVRAAIDVLAELPAPRLLVLGDMGEVGDQGPAFHAEIGHYAATCGIECVFALGELALHTVQAVHFTGIDALNAAVIAALNGSPGTASIVVKGSRFMKMERVLDALQAQSAALALPTGSIVSTSSQKSPTC